MIESLVGKLNNAQDLIEQVRATLPATPDNSVDELIQTFSLSPQAAKILVSADGGLRLDYFQAAACEPAASGSDVWGSVKFYRTLANW